MPSSSPISHSTPIMRKDSSSWVSLLYLPDDLLWNCLARLSRLYYPTLSLVSKRFRSLIASNELYETRKLLGRTESCLYMCLLFADDQYAHNPLWFTLRPTQIPNPNKSSDNVMVPVPTRVSFSAYCWKLIAVGSYIYKIGGYLSIGKPSSKVLFMDCRSHTWHEAPNMEMVSYYSISVSVLDGKIYVAGCKYNSSNVIDRFDPKTQTWEHLPSPNGQILKICRNQSLAIEGKLYLFGKDKNVVYNPMKNRWDDVAGKEMDFATDFCYCSCVVDNVLYRFGWSRIIEWYDSKERSWRVLEGLEELPELPGGFGFVQLVDYGGKIAVLWEKDDKIGHIWCAEIVLERCKKHEIYGKIVWCDDVFTAPCKHYFLQCFATTV